MPEPGNFEGGRLRIARLLSGLTKAELAERLGVSRQFVHSMELDEKRPSAEMVAALALALQVLPSFFSMPLLSEVREEECHFRSRTSMPRKVADQVISRGTALEHVVTFLEKRLRLPVVNFPSFESRDNHSIEHAAAHCRREWKLGLGPISNVCRVLENAGAVVTMFDGERHEIDALSMARGRPIVVRNTLKQSAARQRFDLAHECGHLVLHQGVITGDKETEGQANRFASALLMPRESFGTEFPKLTGRLDWNAIYSLKIRWRVSAKAIVRRAHDLDLLDAIQYATANRFLNYSGQARTERFDERIPGESPEVLKTAIGTYMKTFQISVGEFARELGMTPILIEQLVGGALRARQA